MEVRPSEIDEGTVDSEQTENERPFLQTKKSLGDLFELYLRVPAELCLFLQDRRRERGSRVDAERGLGQRGLGSWLETTVDVSDDGLKVMSEDVNYSVQIYLQILERQTHPARWWCCCCC